MDGKSYSRVAAIIFAIIAVLQLVRALSGWELTLNGGAIPIWASWLASTGALAFVGLPLLENGTGDCRYRFRLCALRGGG